MEQLKTDHVLGHKGSANNYQINYSMQSVVSDHSKIKLENSDKKITENPYNFKQEHTFNYLLVTENIIEIMKYLDGNRIAMSDPVK